MNGGIGAFFLALIALAIELFLVKQIPAPIPKGLLGVAFFALTALPSLLMIGAQYRNWRFAVLGDEVTVMYGVLWKTVRSVPRKRIQHVDVHSGPIDRMFGLAQLSIYTAGSVGAVVAIPGLSGYDAERMRTELLAAQSKP